VSKPKNDKRTTAKNDNRATAKRSHPWADVGGIDYGPAVGPLGDLVTWVFDLAAADVADWPDGKRRVRATRKFVLDRLHGRNPRGVGFDDIFFTAGLIARIFEADLGLGMSEMIAVFDRIGLPTEVVPMMPQVQPSVRTPLRAPAAASVLPFAHPRVAPSVPRPEPCELCGVSTAICEECGCGCGHGYRNAA